MRPLYAALILGLALATAAPAQPVLRCPCMQTGLVDWTSQFTAVWEWARYLPHDVAYPNPNPVTFIQLPEGYAWIDRAHHTHNLTPGSFVNGAYPTLFSTNSENGCGSLDQIEVFNGSAQSIGGNVTGTCGFSCTSDSDFHYTGSFTIGASAYATVVPGAAIPLTRPGVGVLIGNVGNPGADIAGTRKGFSLWYGNDQHYTMRMTPSAGVGPFEISTTGTVALNQWHFVAGRYQTGARQSIVLDGVENNVSSMDVPHLAAWTDFLKVGFASGSFMGQQRKTFAVDAALDDPSLCRLAVCGFDGCDGPCRCDPNDLTQYAYKPLHAYYGNCTLPACNAATFTTLATVTTTTSTTTTSTSSSSTSSSTTTSTSMTTSTTSTSTSSTTTTSTSSTTSTGATTSTTTTSTSSTTTTSTTLAALACTVLDHGSTDTDATSYSSASVSPTGNHLILAIMLNSRDSAPVTPTVSGACTTWTQVQTLAYTTGSLRRMTIHRCLESSPSSGAVTWSFAGTACAGGTGCQLSGIWAILDCSPVVTTGTNGADAIVQSSCTTGTSNAPSVTLSAFGSSNNLNVAVAGAASSTMTNGSGFSLKTSDTTSNRVMTSTVETKLNDNVSLASAGASVVWGICGMEVKAQ